MIKCVSFEEVQIRGIDLKSSHNKKNLFVLQTLDDRLIKRKQDFIQACAETFPAPASETKWNLDALADNLFIAFHHLNVQSIEIFWPFADDTEKTSPAFFAKAIQFFQPIQDLMKSYTYDETQGEQSVEIKLYLVCANETEKSRLEKSLWFLQK